MFPWKPRFKWRSIPTRYVQCFFNSLICTPFSLFPNQFFTATPINHCPPIVLQRTKAMEIIYNIWNSFFINSYSIRLESRLERGRSNELLYPTIKPLKCLISSIMMTWYLSGIAAIWSAIKFQGHFFEFRSSLDFQGILCKYLGCWHARFWKCVRTVDTPQAIREI